MTRSRNALRPDFLAGDAQGDDSYAGVRRQLHAPHFGLLLKTEGLGEGGESEQNALLESFRAGLSSVGLEADGAAIDEWEAGRSVGYAEALLWCTGSVVALFAGIKTIDEGVAIALKWWRGLRAAAGNLGRVEFTVEALKLACIDELERRVGANEIPDVRLLTSAAAALQVGDGTWQVLDPVYFVFPDPARNRTHLVVISLAGEVLHYAMLPNFVDRDLMGCLQGMASSAGAATEDVATDLQGRGWDVEG